jgi:hypothetical protein
MRNIHPKERISAGSGTEREIVTVPDIFFQGYGRFTELECTYGSVFHSLFTGADKPDYLPAAAGADSGGWLRGTQARSPLRT